MKPTDVAEQNRPYFEVPVSEIPVGEARAFEWQGKPFWIVHLNREQMDVVSRGHASLKNLGTVQLEARKINLDRYRQSNTKEILVLSLVSNVSPCGVEFKKGSPSELLDAWRGGFVDKCGKGIYDVAGRAYEQSQADAEELKLIPYSMDGHRLRVHVN
ncbi:hypothetical protein RF679_13255 [Undibacterium cyanobacteriorum]|uniref:Uncharacterized protein n=1 Tax=Undibacterium cyanobacteriorum TaxID=3073561 RepID=A0ABY9REF7_9BURK|nr:hypothetical protein [Undibacterium sp. 20NA77.5]WMW79613.1 hypothetical protein RF679_13255 [Undibacterium sp. 20NA77.5]